MNIIPQKFMCDNRVLSLYDSGIITAFVEHPHVHAGHVGEIDGTVHSALVRAYDHQMVFVHNELRLGAQESLDELVRRVEAVETVERDGILHSGVVGVEGNNIVHAHIR